jgi:hypothetical protein
MLASHKVLVRAFDHSPSRIRIGLAPDELSAVRLRETLRLMESADVVMGHPAVLLIALLVDRIIGDPDWLWRRISHPVVLFGHAIGFADRKFNRPTDRPASGGGTGTSQSRCC